MKRCAYMSGDDDCDAVQDARAQANGRLAHPMRSLLVVSHAHLGILSKIQFSRLMNASFNNNPAIHTILLKASSFMKRL